MTRNLIATSFLSLAFAIAASAQGAAASSDATTHYTRAQLRQLVRNAHAPDQYTALANYYGQRRSEYLEKAAEEKQEWARLSRNIGGVAPKYPRPIDSARNRYEYLMYEASEAGALEAKYSRLAAPDAP